jgi:DNA polymerase-3 subunit gamma/tau
MAYLVLARKWRPQTFEEVIGQEHVTQTLKNAISVNRLSHAYLFSGPRGIGKTTTARILAKALNCEKGPTLSPCNKCDFCKEISQSSSIDVLEIDGASNRGIDEIRDLREKAKYVPAGARSKVYIIDEVHMLTTEAFNALLKILEEPPLHLIFIFATTQPYKVPLTILSRCQRFDFRLLSLEDILGRLKEICKAEKFKVDEESLFLIARRAEGSMRDAQTLLDQAVSYGGKEVKVKDLISLLGIVEEETLFRLTENMIKGKTRDSLILVEEIVTGGYDLDQFLKDLREHFRNLLIGQVSDKPEDLIDLPPRGIKKIVEQAGGFSQDKLLEVIKAISETEKELKTSNQGRLALEMLVIKLTKKEKSIPPAIPPNVPPSIPPREHFPHLEIEDIKEEVIPPEIGLDRLREVWPQVIENLRKEKPALSAYLLDAEPREVKGNFLTLAFRNNFHRENIEDSQNKKRIEGELKKILLRNFRIRTSLSREEKTKPSKPSKEKAGEKKG